MYNMDGVSKVDISNPKSFIMIQGIFFLILALCGNYINSILNCNLQYFITHNIYIKHVITIVIIYFMLTSFSETIDPPLTNILYAFTVWGAFILFSKTGLYFSKFIMALMVALLVCKDYILYYESFDLIDYQDTVVKLTKAFEYGVYVAITTTIVGFILYFKKQYHDHRSNFSPVTFILGNAVCDSMK